MIGEVRVNGCGGLGECGELLPRAGDDFGRFPTPIQAGRSGTISALKFNPERDTESGFWAIHLNLVYLVSVAGFGEEFEAGGYGISNELAVSVAGRDPGSSGNDSSALRPVQRLECTRFNFDVDLSASSKSESGLMNAGVDAYALGRMSGGGGKFKFIESEGVVVVGFTVESKGADGSGSREDWGKSLSYHQGVAGRSPGARAGNVVAEMDSPGEVFGGESKGFGADVNFIEIGVR